MTCGWTDLRGSGQSGHQAGDLDRRTGARQTGAGGRLEDDGERLALRLQPGEKLGGARQGATAPRLASGYVKHPGRDQSCMHVEIDERKLTHAAPPRNSGWVTT